MTIVIVLQKMYTIWIELNWKVNMRNHLQHTWNNVKLWKNRNESKHRKRKKIKAEKAKKI